MVAHESVRDELRCDGPVREELPRSRPTPPRPWLFVVWVIGGPSLGALLLTLTSGTWWPALRDGDPWTLPVFVVATVLLCGLSLAPTHAASLVAGLLYGEWRGSAIALAAILAAALFCALVIGRNVRPTVLDWFDRRPRAAAVHRALLARSRTHTVLFLACVRLSPVMPFAATNLLLVGAGVSLRRFLAGSALGLAPRVSLVAIAGARLGELDLSRTVDRWTLVAGALATFAVLWVLARIARSVRLEPAAATSELGDVS